jgi:hypothetical protein
VHAHLAKPLQSSPGCERQWDFTLLLWRHQIQGKLAQSEAKTCMSVTCAAGAYEQVCDEAPAAAPASPPQQRKELLPVKMSREELTALPVKELKQILTDRNIK